ncbi:unnamed protein product [Cochlearia groenlandica]
MFTDPGTLQSELTMAKKKLFSTRFPMERDIAEIKANQNFLVGIQKGEYPDLEAEAASMAEDLSAVKGKLAVMPLPSLDLADLARMFEDSPPPSEEVESETTLVPVDAHATNGSMPLVAVPPMPASLDQFGSMTASLSVENALNLRESDPPEDSGPRVDGDQASAEGGQEIVPIEGDTAQLGTGSSEETEVVSQT